MTHYDESPTHSLNGVEYRIGHPLPFGASISGSGGINFSISSAMATSCHLLLYHHAEREPFVEIPMDDFRIGNNYSIIVYGLDIDELEYGYRMDGPYDIKKGYRFDRTKILLDPYAKIITGRDEWGKIPDMSAPFQHRGKVLIGDFDWEGDTPLEIPMEDLVIYEMHVRGFTAHSSSGAEYPGTYAGLTEKIPYLKTLGINCVELMPIFSFDEFENGRTLNGRPLFNYWGYSTLGFFAPKSSYAGLGTLGFAADELKSMIKSLHANGIEVILDVVFNHTAEGNQEGPYISYKGLDNQDYYLLDSDGKYLNYSGCGNTMNCNAANVRNHILDCLRYWVSDYHVDGFRFDLASILSRDADGKPMASPPLLEQLSHDPLLGKTKLIAEAWDAGGLYQVGSFPNWGRWAEWNGMYRDCVRRFIKSDEGMEAEMIKRILGSEDLYARRGSNASVNFITCHDGFTLNDLVSYNEKHNDKNGEFNRDGSNNNHSWNCGAEGATDDWDIEKLRNRQIKNAVTLLMISRGTPLIYMGDEFRNTQYGNNNAYCQDNEISWLNWEDLEHHNDTFHYFCKMISLRRSHPILRRTDYFAGKNSSGYPEITFHGMKAWEFEAENCNRTFGMMFAESAADYPVDQDAFIYIGINAHWEPRRMQLPSLPEGMKWRRYVYSADDAQTEEKVAGGIWLTGRSIMVLVAM